MKEVHFEKVLKYTVHLVNKQVLFESSSSSVMCSGLSKFACYEPLLSSRQVPSRSVNV